ncbi:MAG: hypothetical protein IE913_11735 [Halothiobacillus sp.]|nr:hypothetical protein [Halothiobacillus sp.]
MSPTTQAHTFMLDDFLIRESAEPLCHKLDATLSLPMQDGEILNLSLAQIYQDID